MTKKYKSKRPGDVRSCGDAHRTKDVSACICEGGCMGVREKLGYRVASASKNQTLWRYGAAYHYF